MAARAVVIGRSNIGGKPMAQLLLTASCTVTIAHSRTRDLPALARCAEILVAAVGRSGSVRGDWIKHGSVVIDVGINWVPERNPPVIADPPVGHEPQAHDPIQPHPTPPSPRRGPLRARVHRIQRLAGGHEQAVALRAAEADVAADLGQADAPDQLALR